MYVVINLVRRRKYVKREITVTTVIIGELYYADH